MNLVSINLRKGLRNLRNRELLEAWLEKVRPNLLLIQEPLPNHVAMDIQLPSLRCFGVHPTICFFALQSLDVYLIKDTRHWQIVTFNQFEIHNIYASSFSAKLRRELFSAIADYVRDSVKLPLILGDFNTAPKSEDGRYGGEKSSWGTNERPEFNRILLDGRLQDVLALEYTGKQEFSLERKINGRLSQFRCDLALIRGLELDSFQCIYDHSVRTSSGAFTDHSAVCLSFPP